MTQAWRYNEAKVTSGGESRLSTNLSVRRLVFEDVGMPVAICHVLDKAVAGVVVASRINRGPLLIGSDAGDGVALGVYSTLKRRWRHLAHGVLFVGPALEVGDDSDRLLRDAGLRPRRQQGWTSAVLDLRLDEAGLRAHMAPTWRNRLKLAERSGLAFTVSEAQDALDWMLSRHVENMGAKGFVGPSARFVRSLCRASPGDWFVARLWVPGEPDPVAGMLVYQFGNTAEYYVGWFGDAGRKVAAGNLLYLRAILEARRRGCLRFDLGGYHPTSTSETGLRRFKQGLRGVEYTLSNEWLAF
jgi:hypothetical protein